MRFSITAASTGVAGMLASAILASPVGAQNQGTPAFKSGALLSVGSASAGNTNYLMDVSDDKKAWVALLDGLETQLSGTGAPLFATRFFSISMPLAGAEKGVKLGAYLEGHVFHTAGMDISLITTVNGQTHVMDFAAGKLESEDCKKLRSAQELVDAVRGKVGAKYSAAPTKPGIASKPSPNAPPKENDGDFVQCILVDVPSASDLRVNAVLVLHRHNENTQGYVNVTSMGGHILSDDKGAK
jgi:hypothetical protein